MSISDQAGLLLRSSDDGDGGPAGAGIMATNSCVSEIDLTHSILRHEQPTRQSLLDRWMALHAVDWAKTRKQRLRKVGHQFVECATPITLTKASTLIR